MAGDCAFAAAWPERAIVQEPLARTPWYHHIALLEKLDDPAERLWYVRQTIEQGWSHNILVLQIQGHARERQGKALTNFAATLPPGDSDLAAQVFKDRTCSTSWARPTRAASARSSSRWWTTSSASCSSSAPASPSSGGR